MTETTRRGIFQAASSALVGAALADTTSAADSPPVVASVPTTIPAFFRIATAEAFELRSRKTKWAI